VSASTTRAVAAPPATAAALRRALRAAADPSDVAQQARYFKTGPGEYAEGDRFLGVRVPAIRAIVRAHRHATLATARTLLRSRWHEERLLALLLLVARHARAGTTEQQAILDAYLEDLVHVDNWDLVDSSAPHLVGPHVSPDDLGLLERLARSPRVWDRRVAMLATQFHIRRDEFSPALHIAELLRRDPHDMIHKAVGWMLREIGERDRAAEVRFLDAHWHTMPRTAVRYAIEHFTPAARRRYTH
jgi:3-methyladenine DNA glycosylase AlkD